MKKVTLTVEALTQMVRERFPEDPRKGTLNFYGVPRGGTNIAFMLERLGFGQAVFQVEEADYVVDDIVDSGRTCNRYTTELAVGKPFFAPINKLADWDENWYVFPWEETEEASIADSVVRTMQYIGEDVTREGLVDTPGRVVKSWGKLFEGYKMDPKSLVTSFSEGRCDEMVLLTDIEFYSTCEHHMIPFFGRAHIAYLPGEKVLGVSKLARLLDVFARRLQIQERIGQQVTEFLMQECGARGAACMLEAQHLCMVARGVEKQHSVMKTSSLRGLFREDPVVRSEFYSLIK